MTSSELKRNYQANNQDGFFFSKDTMKFFGDTMRNYGVLTHNGHYELFRKTPVNGGLETSAYFTKDTYQLIHGS